jgi:hypothetical protein
VLDQGWEALIVALDPRRTIGLPGVDFWRAEPSGVFYHLRALEDDLASGRGLEPGTQLDFLLQISRVAEVISTGLSFARTLGCDEAETLLIFAFRWTGLAGRELTSWVEPMRSFRLRVASTQNQLCIHIVVPLGTPPDGIPPHVENAVRDLFALFGGAEVSSRVIEEIALQRIRERM